MRALICGVLIIGAFCSACSGQIDRSEGSSAPGPNGSGAASSSIATGGSGAAGSSMSAAGGAAGSSISATGGSGAGGSTGSIFADPSLIPTQPSSTPPDGSAPASGVDGGAMGVSQNLADGGIDL